ncbi:helix-turn-helix transcriptional regulator [Longispora sp. NPDC051575]|uniref:helix-turn-helix domain-containing protein n=1 Tax=Longispora sp. NPDC051575 TaxID=3154943 RepID=UPI003421957E
MNDFDAPMGAILKQARDAAGLSLTQMTERLYRSRGYLSNIENGNKPVPADVIEGYESVLGVGDLLSRLAAVQEVEDDLYRRVLLHWLVTLAPVGVTAPELAEAMRASIFEAIEGAPDWSEVAAEHGRTFTATPERELGPRLLADLVVLRERIKEAPGDLEALRAAAQLSTLHAMTLTNTGQQLPASRWYRTAHAAARRSGDLVLDAWVSGRQAFSRQYGGGSAAEVLLLTEAALAGPPIRCVGLVETLGARARAYAYLGQARKANAALEAAYEIADQIDPGPPDSPFGVATRLPMIAAYVYSYTGDRKAADSRDAVSAAMSKKSARWVAQVELYEARALVASGEPTEAVRHATNVLQALSPQQRNLAVTGLAADVLAALPAPERRSTDASDLAALISA